MLLDSSKIKQQILQQSDLTGIRKRVTSNFDADYEQAIIDQADALEKMTATQGWSCLEVYIMKIIMNALLEEKDRELSKGMINIMQYIDQVIRGRNMILERREKGSGNGS